MKNVKSNLIDQLRTAYGSIETIDPTGDGYKKLTALLDRVPQAWLKDLVAADIKFVSSLARNRVAR